MSTTGPPDASSSLTVLRRPLADHLFEQSDGRLRPSLLVDEGGDPAVARRDNGFVRAGKGDAAAIEAHCPARVAVEAKQGPRYLRPARTDYSS